MTRGLAGALGVVLGAALGGCTPVHSVMNDCMEESGPTPVAIEVRSNGVLVTSAIGGLVRDYPSRAQRLGISGTARVRCDLAAGRATACQIVSESFADVGFGESAERLARQIDHAPGQSIADISVVFTIVGPSQASVPCGFAKPAPPAPG